MVLARDGALELALPSGTTPGSSIAPAAG